MCRIFNEDRRSIISEIPGRLEYLCVTYKRIQWRFQRVKFCCLRMSRSSPGFLVCQKLLNEVRNNQNFLWSVVTGYKTETKIQSSQWEGHSSARPKRARIKPGQRSNRLWWYLFFWIWRHCSSGIFFAQKGDQHQYREVLRCLRDEVCRKHSVKCWRQSWMIQHENDPVAYWVAVRGFLAAKSIGTVHSHSYFALFGPPLWSHFVPAKQNLIQK
jgi:hypothetical protein